MSPAVSTNCFARSPGVVSDGAPFFTFSALSLIAGVFRCSAQRFERIDQAGAPQVAQTPATDPSLKTNGTSAASSVAP